MTHFVYRDYSLGERIAVVSHWRGEPFQVHESKIIFECEAENILEADKQLFEATGIVVSKIVNIGVSCR